MRNPDAPLLDSGAVRVTQRWQQPDAAGADAADLWGEPTQVVVGAHGVYVLDGQLGRIYHHSADGDPRGTIGRPGAGPGELEDARRLQVIAGAGRDTLVVLDGGKGALQLFDDGGAHLASIRLAGVAFAVHALQPGGLVTSLLSGGGMSWQHVALDGSATPFLMPGYDSAGESAAGVGGHVNTAGDRLLHVSLTVPAITEIDVTGAIRRRIVIDRDSTLATPQELAAFRARMESTLAASAVPPPVAAKLMDDQIANARLRRPFGTVRRDPASGLYAMLEQLSADFGEAPATIHLLSPDGIYLARIPFAEGWNGYAFHSGEILALAVDSETGLVRLTAYALDVPAAALTRAAALAAAVP